jgi:hypothetical protein
MARNAYTLDNLHYDSSGVVRVAPGGAVLNLDIENSLLERRLGKGSEAEQAMHNFFRNEVVPAVAYRDNDVNQGKTGPTRDFVCGRLKDKGAPEGLFVRLGVSERLIPALQVLYLQSREEGADRFVHDFTERYRWREEGKRIETESGAKAYAVIADITQKLEVYELEARETRLAADAENIDTQLEEVKARRKALQQ